MACHQNATTNLRLVTTHILLSLSLLGAFFLFTTNLSARKDIIMTGSCKTCHFCDKAMFALSRTEEIRQVIVN